ncbi:unnamed protein product [Sordaria macrospora k-hell]|uniref:WGS project CABT00000000 data, contig 2.32 n=1 Tax=Sordaria macrospora (strain ATCC MYA-333 / DSM 997 / K(L3346) / K-hell) TaxID=771870 RepID=F7W5Y2_SORMK|nr:uncharacterized protein SMAC_06062 [Sordaria macrospora k-hell]CCC12920.1 unnamed protein product [Sordaria macrospora k-hell]
MRRSSSPHSDGAEEPERDDNDVEMALNGDPDEYDEDNNRDQTQDQTQDQDQGRHQDRDQDDLGLPGDNMDMAEENTLEHEHHHDGQEQDRDQDQDQDWQERVNNHTDIGAYDPDHNVGPDANPDADPDAMDTTRTKKAKTTPKQFPGQVQAQAQERPLYRRRRAQRQRTPNQDQ